MQKVSSAQNDVATAQQQQSELLAALNKAIADQTGSGSGSQGGPGSGGQTGTGTGTGHGHRRRLFDVRRRIIGQRPILGARRWRFGSGAAGSGSAAGGSSATAHRRVRIGFRRHRVRRAECRWLRVIGLHLGRRRFGKLRRLR